MKILVTGGTGLLGKNLIERLISESHEVKALVRKSGALKDFKIDEIDGNLRNIQEWKQALQGCDAVIHCAAKVEFWGKWEDYYRDNTLSTLELLEAADALGVKRFVYISSESVLQHKKDLIDIDENEPYPTEPSSFYGKSKMLAEKGIQSFNGGITKIILRPTFIYGKGAVGIQSMKDKIQSGGFMWIDKGNVWVEMVYVKNVVEAIMKSLIHGKNNGIYNITDHSPQMANNFFTQLMHTENVTISNKSMPSSLAKPVAALVEKIWKTFGLKSYPPLTRFDLSFIAMNRKYKTEKAISELHYQPVYTTAQALEEMKK